MKLEIVTIGTELLLGYTLDSNGAELGRALAAAGVEVVRRTSVPDRREAIRAAVAEALERTGFVISTGGLGPTRDDLTKTVVAELFGRTLVLDEALLAALEARFKRMGRWPMPAANRSQAEVPEGATVLPNPAGTAPGLWLEDSGGRVAVLLPGVPREMRGLVLDEVLPRLEQRSATSRRVVRSRTVRTTGVPESALAERVGPIEDSLAPLTLAYLPSVFGVDLRLTAWDLEPEDADARLAAAARQVARLVGEHYYGDDDSDLAAVVLEALRQQRHRLGVAESCIKVPLEVIEAHGAVSEETVRAMAEGAQRLFAVDCSMAVTGVAGPSGGTPDKPVGTVWLAARVHTDSRAVRRVFPGDRDEIRRRAAQAALDLLRRLLAPA